MLFDARAHEPLLDVAWRPAEVQAEIRAIAREADEALRDGEWWPVHPLDAEDDDPDVFHGIYLGAAGVLWALHRLAQAGLHAPRHDYSRLAREVLDSYLSRPEFDGPLPSLYGSTEEILGPAHGLAGVVAALAPPGPPPARPACP